MLAQQCVPGRSEFVKRCILKLGTNEASAKSVVLDAGAIVADLEAGRIGEARRIAAMGGPNGENSRRALNRFLARAGYGTSDFEWSLAEFNIINVLLFSYGFWNGGGSPLHTSNKQGIRGPVRSGPA